MGFGGGGGGALPAHVHNLVPLQGGPLDFANDTIASLNAGSTTFSDGAALQELVIGNPSDALVVNAGGTAPEWGSAGGVTLTRVTDAMTTTFSTTSLTFVDVTGFNITKPTIVGGTCFTTVYVTTEAFGGGGVGTTNSVVLAVETDGAITAVIESGGSNALTKMSGQVCITDMTDSDGTVIQIQIKAQQAGTGYINHNASDSVGTINCLGIG